jgi:hypothetical protein
MKSIINIFVFVILLSLVLGCGSSRPTCISKHTESLVIRWGERSIKNGFTKAYMMTAKPEIISINKESEYKELVQKKLKDIEGSYYCSKLSIVQRVIMNNQTLSVPADTVRFIEYENPAAKVFISAEWNPKYITVANRDFRILYDSLQAMIKE